MSEHTPGPWKADANSGWFPWPEAIGIFSDCETVAWTTSMASARERDEANARLIAAAPEMLGALKELVEQILDYERINNLAPNPGLKYCWRATERAAAAIEIATGTALNHEQR